MSWRQLVARGALLTMEALWVFALVILVVSLADEGQRPGLIGVGLVVFLSYTISRLLQSGDMDLGILRVWGVVASVLLFYAIARVDFFGDWRFWDFGWADRLAADPRETLDGQTRATLGIPLLWLVWMRGVSRGQLPLIFEAVVSSFATGVVIIVVIELLAGELDAPGAVGYVAVPYIALGLLAIGLTHAARSESEYGRSFSWTWLASMGGAVLVLSLLAAVFVFIDLSTMAEAIIFAGRLVGVALFAVFYVFGYAIAFALQFVVEGLVSLLGLDPQPIEPPEEAPPPLGEEREIGSGLPAWAEFVGRAIAGSFIFALAVAALYYTFARFQKRRPAGALKESTYHEGRLGADLGNFLGAMLGRLRPNLHFGGEHDPVRRLYHDMLDEASGRGIVRGPAETPLELAPRLDAAFGPPTPSRITALFDDARYGALRAPAEAVRRLREDWEAARRA